jgi:hypothetical protein
MSAPRADFVVTPKGATLADRQSRIDGLLVWTSLVFVVHSND